MKQPQANYVYMYVCVHETQQKFKYFWLSKTFYIAKNTTIIEHKYIYIFITHMYVYV